MAAVGTENPVRFIEVFFDGLDLTAAGYARVTPKVTGRPGYAPTDLLKFYIYGYLNRVRPIPKREAENQSNVEVIWLLRHLKPEFKTIADFRRDNASAFRPISRVCAALPPVGPVWPGVDRGGRQRSRRSQPC
jgi:transposase